MLMVAIALSALSLLYTVRNLGFTTDRNEVLGTPDRYHQNYLALKREFGVDDEIVVVFRGPRPGQNRAAVDFVAAALRAQPANFSSVMEKIDLDFVRHKLLLYLPTDVLLDLEKRLQAFAPLIRQVLETPGLVPLFDQTDEELQTGIHAAVREAMQGKHPRIDEQRMRQMEQALPMLRKLLDGMTESLDGAYTYSSLWMSMLPPAPRPSELPPLEELPKAQYLTIRNGYMYLLMAVPRLDPESNNATGDRIAQVKALLAQARARFPDVEFGITGKPALENDEFEVAMSDSERATVVSVVGVILLFLVTFHHLMRPALAMFCLLLALSWTMGFTTLVIGRLNILTINAMPMLVGLGIDFGIQVVCRYGEERGRGLDPLEAMARTLSGTGTSIIAAGVTTSASFYAAWFTEFKGFQELALLSGTGLIFCLICMLTVYPALILMVEKREMRRGGAGSAHRATPLTGMTELEGPILRHPWAVVGISALLLGASVAATSRLQFDANVLHLQARGTPAVEWERRVYEASGHGLLYAAVVADDIEQARRLQKRLEALPTVAEVTGPTLLVPEEQARKIPIVERIHAIMEGIPSLTGPLRKVNGSRLRGLLNDLRNLFMLVFPEAKKAGASAASDEVRALVFRLDAFLQRAAGTPPDLEEERLDRYQASVFADLADKLDLLRGAREVRPVRVEDVPAGIRAYMISKAQRVLLRVFPRQDIWDEKPMRRFLDSVGTVYPPERLTGTAMQVYMAAIAIRRSCEKAGVYALVVIVVTLLLHFRSAFLTVLGMIPLGLGLLWTGGILYASGIDLNPANYMALPLILGIGVANGVYVVRRFQEEGTPTLFTVSTGRAIILSNLTATIGFGSLMVARHAGMRSLGLVMSIGILICAVAALTVLPSMLKILQDRGFLPPPPAAPPMGIGGGEPAPVPLGG
jgi:hopanoid biosynthesis associated RND transporter like protein HpnN